MRIRALDSIRGLLLLQMTLDHFGKPFSHYLYQCFGFFSAAEGFFFLSGFVGMLAATSKNMKNHSQNWMRKRACKTWIYHILTLYILCLLSYLLMPKVAHYFSSIYNYPIQSIFFTISLINTPEWLDVLPLYVLFLFVGSFVFPLFLKAKKESTLFILWVPSVIIWIFSQFGLRDFINSWFPTWIYHGDFDPFGWQFVYFTGAISAAWWNIVKNKSSVNKFSEIQILKKGTPIFLVLFLFLFFWSHQFISLELPNAFFTNKVSVGPLRFANFFIFVLLISYIIRTWPNLLDFRITNTLGKKSLNVYTMHIVFIYLWMALPNSIRYHNPWNIITPIITCILLWALAKLGLWKDRDHL